MKEPTVAATHHPDCKHPGPHDELCSCALLELRDLRAEGGRLRKVLDAARFAVQVGQDHRRYPASIEAVAQTYGYALDCVATALEEYDRG